MDKQMHTPGPWQFISQSDWPYMQTVNIRAEDFGVVATVSLDPHLSIIDQQRANLRLIAAAPETAAELARVRELNAELVAALCDLLPSLPEVWSLDGAGMQKRVLAARAAIAKAKEQA